ncbi:MAG TPA: hypothetical protein VF679_10110, partial [Pedobacter sp.]
MYKRIPSVALILLCLITAVFSQNKAEGQVLENKGKYVLVIHGGAGTILKSQMTPEKESAYKAVLNKALQTGYSAL